MNILETKKRVRKTLNKVNPKQAKPRVYGCGKRGRVSRYDNSKTVAKVYEYALGGYTKTPFNEVIPTREGLSLYLGIATELVRVWSKKYPDFDAAYQFCKTVQGTMLLNGSLSNVYNPAISKMLLCKHGYSDTPEEKVSAEDIMAAMVEYHKRMNASIPDSPDPVE